MTAKAVCTRRQTQLGWPYAHSYIPENSECRAVGASWWFRSCIGSTALVESFCFRSLVQVPSLVTSPRLPRQLAADDTGLSALTCSRSDWLLAFAAFVLIWNANRTSPSGFAGGFLSIQCSLPRATRARFMQCCLVTFRMWPAYNKRKLHMLLGTRKPENAVS